MERESKPKAITCCVCGKQIASGEIEKGLYRFYEDEFYCRRSTKNDPGERPCEEAYIKTAFPHAVGCLVTLEGIADIADSDGWESGIQSAVQLCFTEGEQAKMKQIARGINLVVEKLPKDLAADFRLSSRPLYQQLRLLKKAMGPMAKAAKKFRIDRLKEKLMAPDCPVWGVIRAFVQARKDVIEKKIPDPVLPPSVEDAPDFSTGGLDASKGSSLKHDRKEASLDDDDHSTKRVRFHPPETAADAMDEEPAEPKTPLVEERATSLQPQPSL